MEKIIAIFATFSVLPNVFGASELTADEKWTKLKGMNCHYERVSSFGWGEIVDLNEVLDAKPIGFRTKLQYTAIGVKETGIYLSSAENANEFIDSPCYWIHFGNWRGTSIVLQRRNNKASRVDLYEGDLPDIFDSEVPANVLIAVTDDGAITLNVDGKTLFTYHDPKLLLINYFRFDTFDPDAEFYYNCTSKQSNQTMASNAEQTGDLPVRTDNPIELIEQRQGISKSTTEFQLKSVSEDNKINSLTTELDNQRQEIEKLNARLAEISTPIWVHVAIISIIFGILTVASNFFILHKLGFFSRGIREELVKL